MYRLAKMYHPITGTPYQCDETYREVPPCDALKPFIRCFWGTERPVSPKGCVSSAGIVIPDTCMDVIFDVNYTRNTAEGIFCCLDETSALTESRATTDLTAAFGIRFFAWTAVLFADEELKGTKNKQLETERFSKRIHDALSPVLFDAQTLQEKQRIAERVLLGCLTKERAKADVMNAVYRILKTKGRERAEELAAYAGVSGRKLERDFDRMMGLSPKGFSSLVRYQLLWQDIAFTPSFHILDAVDTYGYTDQAHLLHDFKRRHLMTPGEALQFAKEHR